MRRSSFFLVAFPVVVGLGIWFLEKGFRRSGLEGNSGPNRESLSVVSERSPSASERQWRRMWTHPAGMPLTGAPAALYDGWVVATETGAVVALNQRGGVLWTRTLSNMPLVGSPAVAGTTVVVAGADGQVAALDARTGFPVWKARIGGSLLHGPLVLQQDGKWRVVLLSSNDGVLRCLEAGDGKAVWESEPTNRSDGMPATDGHLIAFGNCDSAVHLLDAATGKRVAKVPVGEDAQMAGGVLFHNGCVYGGTRAGALVCVEADGRHVAWQAQLSDAPVFTTPVAARDGVIMGTSHGTVALFEAGKGRERWRVSVSNEVSALCVMDDAVFAVAGGDLHGLRLSDGARFFRLAIGDKVMGPVANGGVLAVADDGGSVIAVMGEPSRKGLR